MPRHQADCVLAQAHGHRIGALAKHGSLGSDPSDEFDAAPSPGGPNRADGESARPGGPRARCRLAVRRALAGAERGRHGGRHHGRSSPWPFAALWDCCSSRSACCNSPPAAARFDTTKAIANSNPDGLLVTDRESRILYANEAYRVLSGARAAERAEGRSSACSPGRRTSPSRSTGCRRRPSRARARARNCASRRR